MDLEWPTRGAMEEAEQASKYQKLKGKIEELTTLATHMLGRTDQTSGIVGSNMDPFLQEEADKAKIGVQESLHVIMANFENIQAHHISNKEGMETYYQQDVYQAKVNDKLCEKNNKLLTQIAFERSFVKEEKMKSAKFIKSGSTKCINKCWQQKLEPKS